MDNIRIIYKILFQSTLPTGEATIRKLEIIKEQAISIHASRGGSDTHKGIRQLRKCIISIHASRGGSDYHLIFIVKEITYISIHASRGGSDTDAGIVMGVNP